MASSSSALQYPYPSALNPASFVSIKLSSSVNNYSLWGAQMLCLLESQELDGFIDGTIPIPNGGTSTGEEVDDNYRRWKRSDRLVKGWILGSLQVNVLATVVDLSTAKEVWMELLSTLGPNSQGNKQEDEEDEEDEMTGLQHVRLTNFPYPSAINVSNFISIKLTRNNYYEWSTQIFSLLNSRELMGFIMDQAPPKYYVGRPNENRQRISKNYKGWERTDLLVQRWILDTISEELISMVTGLATSRDIMVKLEKTFVPNIEDYFISQRPMITMEAPPRGNDQTQYLQLYKAGLEGDWAEAKRFMDRDRGASTAVIAFNGETIIHVAVCTGKAIHFLKSLVEYLAIQDLCLKNSYGDTPLVSAAKVGNTEAAKILMEKSPALLHIKNNELMLPLHVAAQSGHRDTLLYFQSLSCNEDYAGEAGADHLSWTITHGFIDISLDLISRYPHMGRLETSQNFSSDPLSELAEQVSFFQSANHLNVLQSLIYTCIPLKFENYSNGPNGGGTDVENQAYNFQVLMNGCVYLMGVCKGLHIMIWDVMELFVPLVKKLRQKKLVHHQAVQLVKCLCEGIRSTNDAGAYVTRTTRPVTVAASLGTFEIVEEIVKILPIAIWSRNKRGKGHGILQLAVINRCEKVFNLVYQMSEYRHFITIQRDESRNSILHLAGRLAPLHKLNLVSGAALQMQRELQWFKEVTKIFGPTYKGMKNSDGESPGMIFTKEHKELVIAGEKWMRDTASSCTITAALIITMVFAAAKTVPGGNNGDNGLPIFSNGRAFWLFAISDAFSLFSSTTSLFMFLSILTARYAEEDFLHALPKRLILGLLMLFLSIVSMIIAFSATVYLVFGQERGWTIIPLAALSCLPITSFVTLQFPLLIDVYSSTYGRGIFGKQSDRTFH